MVGFAKAFSDFFGGGRCGFFAGLALILSIFAIIFSFSDLFFLVVAFLFFSILFVILAIFSLYKKSKE